MNKSGASPLAAGMRSAGSGSAAPADAIKLRRLGSDRCVVGEGRDPQHRRGSCDASRDALLRLSRPRERLGAALRAPAAGWGGLLRVSRCQGCVATPLAGAHALPGTAGLIGKLAHHMERGDDAVRIRRGGAAPARLMSSMEVTSASSPAIDRRKNLAETLLTERLSLDDDPRDTEGRHGTAGRLAAALPQLRSASSTSETSSGSPTERPEAPRAPRKRTLFCFRRGERSGSGAAGAGASPISEMSEKAELLPRLRRLWWGECPESRPC